MTLAEGFRLRQAGMVLLVSLVLLLLLSLIGLSSMQAALTQQKIAGSFWHRNQSLQSAESGLRRGESAIQRSFAALPLCQSIVDCAPPEAAFLVVGPGVDPVSGISWVALKGGLYGVQSLGPAVGLAHLPAQIPAAVYRVTAVGLHGQLRTVLESTYARVEEEGGSRFRRVAWRQLQ
ncbi:MULTISPECIES: PilX N-terminal domain-containing pilus assembly protein [unclassified Pseudomonas]|jgi:type IV pilus assembly protein PilX|uniref:PilX N-terminal domain-containing pilus assembly protein n=1 Tax=unclassified Pseudomonas TaxID=196821 RepID=UPI0008F33B46|nr:MULTISPECIES: PilX N-terminal domain-containing pilus assembly protein [unclassified Pseudomonas]SFB14257.1 type IV pilus assembly protein PilX [Pseudomonas sp. NFPP24]SFH76299.1 type IV pilus assembly protein PilX [Pseudomonas sp. NFPP04]SFI22024.1 type IV pilus assembly protein PilX [Pseudomonas sp. NFPP11]SFO87137.1 type IV pilus assembly protein PilX [Pseudomonas sp. NFPP28]